jgi:hypothetical protein
MLLCNARDVVISLSVVIRTLNGIVQEATHSSFTNWELAPNEMTEKVNKESLLSHINGEITDAKSNN